jgi:hypothetical protein
MKTTEKKLKKVFGKRFDELFYLGLLTGDTKELVVPEQFKELPVINAGRKVYLIDPNNSGCWGGGLFDGEYVGKYNIYVLLMFLNYPEFVDDKNFTEDYVQEMGLLLSDSQFVEDSTTGRRWVNTYYDHTCFPGIEKMPASYADPILDSDTRSVNELVEIGILKEGYIRDIYPILLPIKLSYNKNARYEDMEESEPAAIIDHIEIQAINHAKKIKKG